MVLTSEVNGLGKAAGRNFLGFRPAEFANWLRLPVNGQQRPTTSDQSGRPDWLFEPEWKLPERL